MNTIRFLGAAALILTLAGCAAEGPAADGASVRAMLASQVIAPQPRASGKQGSDGAAAVAAYANYKQSYVVPQPQGDSTLVGSRK